MAHRLGERLTPPIQQDRGLSLRTGQLGEGRVVANRVEVLVTGHELPHAPIDLDRLPKERDRLVRVSSPCSDARRVEAVHWIVRPFLRTDALLRQPRLVVTCAVT